MSYFCPLNLPWHWVYEEDGAYIFLKDGVSFDSSSASLPSPVAFKPEKELNSAGSPVSFMSEEGIERILQENLTERLRRSLK